MEEWHRSARTVELRLQHVASVNSARLVVIAVPVPKLCVRRAGHAGDDSRGDVSGTRYGDQLRDSPKRERTAADYKGSVCIQQRTL